MSTPRRRARGAVAALLVLAPLALAGLAGCSGDEYAAYCDEVDDQRPALSEAAELGPTTGLLTALPSFEALSEAAPGDISDDWSVVVDRLGALDRALAAADVDPATYDPKKPPTGLEPAEQSRIRGAATQLLNPVTAEALGVVEQQARDVCGAPLLS